MMRNRGVGCGVRGLVTATAAVLALLALLTGEGAAATVNGKVTSLASTSLARPQPLAGADVRLIDPLTLWWVSTTTDATGGYSLFAPAGSYDLIASKPGMRPFRRDAVDLSVDGQIDALLVPDGAVHLTGSVLDSDERPVAGAFVQASYPDDRGSLSGAVWTETDATGRFQLAPRAGASRLFADTYNLRGPRTWAFRSDIFTLSADRDIELRAPPTEHVTVRAVGPGGEPVPNAAVALPQLDHSAIVAGLSGIVSERTSAITDAGGAAAVPIFPGGRRTSSWERATVDPERDYARTEFDLPEPVAGGTSVEVAVAAADRHLVVGTLSDENGPMSGVELDTRRGFFRTDAAGAFRIPGLDGGAFPFYIRATDGSWDADVNTTLVADRALSLVLPRRYPVTVRVRDYNGDPVPGADVSMPLMRATSDLGGDLPGTQLRSSGGGLTDADGTRVARAFDGAVADLGSRGSVYYRGLQRSFTVPPVDGPATITVVLPLGTDVTPPTVSCDPPAAGAGWRGGNVAIACTAQDSGSGLADPRADTAFTVTTEVPAGREDAAAITARRVVCDNAGNCSPVGPYGPYAVDNGGPQIDWELSPRAVTGEWWSVSRVTVALSVSDATVSTVACAVDGLTRTFTQTRTPTAITGTFSVTLEGRHTIGCTATDRLGHISSRTGPVNIDLKPPTAPTATADRPFDTTSGTGWYRDTVTVAFAETGDQLLADGSPGSGIDPATLTAPQTFSETGTFTAVGTVADRVGRVSARRSLVVRVDAEAPETTITCPPQVGLGTTASASWQASDVGSGLAHAARGTTAIDTSALGPATVTRTATDRVGHTASASCTTTVVYPLLWRGGLLEPPTLNPVAPGVTSLSVLFSLGGDRGLGVLISTELEPVDCSTGTGSGRSQPAATDALSYDTASRRYVLPWQVAIDLPVGSCAALRLGFDDGTTHDLRFAR